MGPGASSSQSLAVVVVQLVVASFGSDPLDASLGKAAVSEWSCVRAGCQHWCGFDECGLIIVVLMSGVGVTLTTFKVVCNKRERGCGS